MKRTWTRTASLARWRQRAPRYLIGGAWFFIAFTLAHLAWVIGTKWSDPAGLTTLYQTTVVTTAGEETLRAFGLAYNGVPGLLLAMLQAGVVVGAAVMSTRSNPRRRRIGHAILVAWAALWMGDLLHLAAIDHRLDSIGQAGLLTALFACTLYRALAPRSRRRDDGVPPLIDEPEELLSIPPPEEVADAPSRLERAQAVGARTIDRSKRAAARVRERGGPIASATGRRLRSGARRFGEWLRSKGLFPATGRAG